MSESLTEYLKVFFPLSAAVRTAPTGPVWDWKCLGAWTALERHSWISGSLKRGLYRYTSQFQDQYSHFQNLGKNENLGFFFKIKVNFKHRAALNQTGVPVWIGYEDRDYSPTEQRHYICMTGKFESSAFRDENIHTTLEDNVCDFFPLIKYVHRGRYLKQSQEQSNASLNHFPIK